MRVALKHHLEKLEYFCSIAEEGSFRRAAEKLNISQPSLTRAVAILEDSVGRPLFIRSLRGIVMTPQGEQLKKFCDSLFQNLDDLEYKLHHLPDSEAGIIRIGTYDSIAIYFWPQFLKAFAEKYPSIKVILKTGRSAAIIQDLVMGAVDVAVTVEPHLYSNFETIELYRDTYEFYQSPNYSKSERRYFDESTKRIAVPVILMADALNNNGQRLEESLLRSGINFEEKYVVTSLETAKEFARNSLGIAALPTQVARTYIKEGTLKVTAPKIGHKVGQHRICATFAREKFKLAIYQSFIAELRSFLPIWLKR